MLNIDDLKKMGINLATLKKMARQMESNPVLKQAFEQQLRNKGFHDTVENFYEEIKDLFDHDNSPK